MSELPTPLTMQRIGLRIRVWCKACHRQRDVDPQILINLGRGDVPPVDLHYRCMSCGSRRTDWVVSRKHTGP